jgi:hypothetical protein
MNKRKLENEKEEKKIDEVGRSREEEREVRQRRIRLRSRRKNEADAIKEEIRK